jgi:hypothetical protein
MFPPFVSGGGGGYSLAGEGVGGGSQFGQGDRHCGTQGVYIGARALFDIKLIWFGYIAYQSPVEKKGVFYLFK